MSANAMLRPAENPDGINYLMLRTAMRLYDKAPRELEQDQFNGLKQQVFKEFELQNLILSSDEARDIIVPDSLLTSTIEDIKKRYKDEDEFLQDLEDNGLNESGFRSALLRELKVDTALERVASRSISISDMEVMIYYHLHKERFHVDESRTVRHILITINEEFPDNTREQALTRINSLYQRLIKKPKRFSEQAMKHSECPTAMNGGLLGRVPRGELYPELDAVLFSMKAGKISKPIESELGFHLLYCETIHDSGPVSLKEARPKIVQHLQERARRMCQKAWIVKLNENAKSQTSLKGKHDE